MKLDQAAYSITISRVLHAGYVFAADDKKILMDPVFENPFSHNCYAFPELVFDEDKISKAQFDAIFISHVHDDHLCLKSLNRLNKNTPIYLYADNAIYFEMLKKLKFEKIYKLHINESIEIGNSLKITPRLAVNSEVDSIFHIQHGPLNILNVVDSWIDPETFKSISGIKKWDMVLWPFQTMRELEVLSPNRASRQKEIPTEWVDVLKRLNPRFTVPSSCQFIHEKWSWYNEALFPISYEDFKKWLQVHLPESKYLRIDPGQSFRLYEDRLVPDLSLEIIKETLEARCDYEYKLDHVASSTASIANHLKPLSQIETNFILQYCTTQLAVELNEKKESLDCFIGDSCLWRLFVYSIENNLFEFNYRISPEEVSLLSNVSVSSDDITWQTEIPIQKLYSALKKGETLTSLYLRINDRSYSESVEKKIKKIDILEDPLIRILFDGKSHRYHEQQLIDLGLSLV